MPVARFTKNISSFCSALKEVFIDRSSYFGKERLELLLDEIEVIK